MYSEGLTRTPSNFRRGSVFIEAAVIFPLIIAIAAFSLSTAAELYTEMRDKAVEDKKQTLENYKSYEKRRLYLSIYRDDTVLAHVGAARDNNGKS